DQQGNIWLATRNGLNKLLLDDKQLTQDNADRMVAKKYFEGITRNKIDSRGQVWGSSMNGFAFRITPGEQTDRIDTLPVESYCRYPVLDKGLERFVQLMIEDTVRGKMYFVMEFSIAEIDIATHDARFLSEGRYHMGIFNYDGCIDASRVLWYSENSWLQQFDLATNKMTRVVAIDPNHNAAVNSASCTFIDRTGMVWIGTKGYGILKYNPRSEKFHNTDNASIGWMAALPDGKVSLAKKEYALCLFNPTKQRYDLQVRDTVLFKKYPLLEFAHTDALAQDADGTFWMCKNGLVAYNAATGTMTSYKRNDDLLNGVFPLYNDSDFIWLGTGFGFTRFNKRTKAYTDHPYPVSYAGEPYSFLQRIHKDASGIFWLGTLQGLLRFDPFNQTWKQFSNDPSDTTSLGNNTVFAICPDPVSQNTYLWIGTNGGGLNRLDIATGKFVRFTERNGLPNNVVYGILSDDDGNLWMSTNKGLTRFNISTKQFKNFGSRDGLQSDEFNRNAYCKTSDGILFFGGVNGFNFFNPRDLVNNDVVPNVLITDFKLSNQSVSIHTEQSPLTQPAYLTSDVTLPFSRQMITLVFASTDFTASTKNNYRYKLEGFSDAWIDA
ncbi:MAG TPA: two-component regulator propeller domain-containing protein, partial [Chitinophagales bacterium]|nr:two-component regulator propeller domain-containing protein [Chitinophagales bacterium]